VVRLVSQWASNAHEVGFSEEALKGYEHNIGHRVRGDIWVERHRPKVEATSEPDNLPADVPEPDHPKDAVNEACAHVVDS